MGWKLGSKEGTGLYRFIGCTRHSVVSMDIDLDSCYDINDQVPICLCVKGVGNQQNVLFKQGLPWMS